MGREEIEAEVRAHGLLIGGLLRALENASPGVGLMLDENFASREGEGSTPEMQATARAARVILRRALKELQGS